MNNKKKMIFSSANLVFLTFWISFFVKYSISLMYTVNFKGLLVGIFMMSIYFVYRYPLFVSIYNLTDKNKDEGKFYSRKTKFYENLYLGFFNKGRSNLISIFSGYNLKTNIKDRLVSSSINPIIPKKIHRALDLMFMIFSLCFGVIFAASITTFSWPCGLVFFVISILLGYRPFLLKYLRSVNIETRENCKINLVLPSGDPYQSININYGAAFIFSKTILIDEFVIGANNDLKEYVIAHEQGHILKSSKKLWFREVFSNFLLLGCILMSFVLYDFLGLYYSFIPAIIYILFIVLIIFPAKKKEELLADSYACQKIGEERCIKALQLIMGHTESDSRSKLSDFINLMFFGAISMEERIKNIRKRYNGEKS